MEQPSFTPKNRIKRDLSRREADRHHIDEELVDAEIRSESFKERRATAFELELRERISLYEWWGLEDFISSNERLILQLNKETREAVLRHLVWAGMSCDSNYDRDKYILPVLGLLTNVYKIGFSDEDFQDVIEGCAFKEPLYVIKIAQRFNKSLDDPSWGETVKEAIDIRIKNGVIWAADLRVYLGDVATKYRDEYYALEDEREHPMLQVEKLFDALGERLDISKYSEVFDEAIGGALRRGNIRAAEGLIKAYFDREKTDDGKPVPVSQTDYFDIFSRHSEDLQQGYVDAICSWGYIDVDDVVARTGILPDWGRDELRIKALHKAHDIAAYGQVYDACELLKISGQESRIGELKEHVIRVARDHLYRGAFSSALFLVKDFDIYQITRDQREEEEGRFEDHFRYNIDKIRFIDRVLESEVFQELKAMKELYPEMFEVQVKEMTTALGRRLVAETSQESLYEVLRQICALEALRCSVRANIGERLVNEAIDRAASYASLDEDVLMLHTIDELGGVSPEVRPQRFSQDLVIDHLINVLKRHGGNPISMEMLQKHDLLTHKRRAELTRLLWKNIREAGPDDREMLSQMVYFCRQYQLTPELPIDRSIAIKETVRYLSGGYWRSKPDIEECIDWVERMGTKINGEEDRLAVLSLGAKWSQDHGWKGFYQFYRLRDIVSPRLGIDEMRSAIAYASNRSYEETDLIAGLKAIDAEDVKVFAFEATKGMLFQQVDFRNFIDSVSQMTGKDRIYLLEEGVLDFFRKQISVEYGNTIRIATERFDPVLADLKIDVRMDSRLEEVRVIRAKKLFRDALIHRAQKDGDEYCSRLSSEDKDAIARDCIERLLQERNAHKLEGFLAKLPPTLKLLIDDSGEPSAESVARYFRRQGLLIEIEAWINEGIEKQKNGLEALLCYPRILALLNEMDAEQKERIAQRFFRVPNQKYISGWRDVVRWGGVYPDLNDDQVRRVWIKNIGQGIACSGATEILGALEARGLRSSVDPSELPNEVLNSIRSCTDYGLYDRLTGGVFTRDPVARKRLFNTMDTCWSVVRWGKYFDAYPELGQEIKKDFQLAVIRVLDTKRSDFQNRLEVLQVLIRQGICVPIAALDPHVQAMYLEAPRILDWMELIKSGIAPCQDVGVERVCLGYKEALMIGQLDNWEAATRPFVDGNGWMERLRSDLQERWSAYVVDAVFSAKKDIVQIAEQTRRITGKEITDYLPDVIEQISAKSYTYFPDFATTNAIIVAAIALEKDFVKNESLLLRWKAVCQAICDGLLINGLLSPDEAVAMQEKIGVIPSQESLKLAVLHDLCGQASIGTVLTQIVNLLKYKLEDLSFEDAVFERDISVQNAVRLYYSEIFQGTQRNSLRAAIRKKSHLASLALDVAPMRRPSARAEFCPYKKIEEMLTNGSLGSNIDYSKEFTRAGILRYLRAFGFNNNPTLCRTLIDLYEACSGITTAPLIPARIRQVTVENIKAAIGLGTGDTVELIIDRLVAFQKNIAHWLLHDQPFPPGFESNPLVMELFNAFVPHAGIYSSKAGREALIVQGREAVGDAFKVPSFLQREVLKVVVSGEGYGEEKQEKIAKVDRLISLKAGEEPVQMFLRPWREGMRTARMQETFHPGFWFTRLEDRCLKKIEELQRKSELITNEKGKKAILSQLDKWKGRWHLLQMHKGRLEEQFESGDFRGKNDNETSKHAIEATVVALQGIFSNEAGSVDRASLIEEAREELHGLVYLLMRLHSPAHIASIEEAEKNQVEGFELRRVRAWSELFYDEYLEHMLRDGGSDVGEEANGGEAKVAKKKTESVFHPWVLEVVHALWKTKGIGEELRQAGKDKLGPKHPLADVVRGIAALEQKKDAIVKEKELFATADLNVYPVKGLGRALAGDIANACYNKHREELMRGGYKKNNSFTV